MDAIGPMAGRLQVFVDDDASGSPVVAARGDIDINTAPQLDTFLLAQAERVRARPGGTPAVVLDLSEVVFFGSVALEAMLRTRDVLAVDGARLHVVVTDHVRRSLTILGMTGLFELHDKPEDALTALRAE